MKRLGIVLSVIGLVASQALFYVVPVYAASVSDNVLATRSNLYIRNGNQANYGLECSVKQNDLTSKWRQVLGSATNVSILDAAMNDPTNKAWGVTQSYNAASDSTTIQIFASTGAAKVQWYNQSSIERASFQSKTTETIYYWTINPRSVSSGGTSSSQDNCTAFSVTAWTPFVSTTTPNVPIGSDQTPRIHTVYVLSAATDRNFPVGYAGVNPTTTPPVAPANPTKDCSPINLQCWFSVVFSGFTNSFFNLGQALLSGIAYLFTPDGDTFAIQFDELMEFFSEKFGFLFYPIEWIIDTLTGLVAGITDDVSWSTTSCSIPALDLGLSETPSWNFFGTPLPFDKIACNAFTTQFAYATRVLFPALISFALLMMFRHKIHEIKTKA